MAVVRCHFCRTPIQWLNTSLSRRLPFNHEPVEIADLGSRQGWIVSQRGSRFLVVPLAHVGRSMAAGVRRVFLVHSCEEFQAPSTGPR